MIFSTRLPRELHTNQLSELLAEKRSAGTPVLDLTESNPTHAGIVYPAGFLSALSNEEALRYEPEPFGLPSARETIAFKYNAPYSRVILTASTSEAYAWLFKLLCDAGDEILIPRPSYPLFDFLASLESVSVKHYSLFYDHGWFIDFKTLRDAITPLTRAIVVVNPNNPTGHFLRWHELAELTALGLPIISDEVFRDYLLDRASDSIRTLQSVEETLVFTLNGLSKTVGLPQMKLAWMIANGPRTQVSDALARLELIADTYLSAGTPVQTALPSLLDLRLPVQRQITARTRDNLDYLRASGLRTLQVEAGWYAIVTIFDNKDDDLALRLLRDQDVLVQPGYFYDFEQSGYLVLSLLSRTEDFREGVERIKKA